MGISSALLSIRPTGTTLRSNWMTTCRPGGTSEPRGVMERMRSGKPGSLWPLPREGAPAVNAVTREKTSSNLPLEISSFIIGIMVVSAPDPDGTGALCRNYGARRSLLRADRRFFSSSRRSFDARDGRVFFRFLGFAFARRMSCARRSRASSRFCFCERKRLA